MGSRFLTVSDASIQMNSETFLLSNMVPQLPGLNRAGWKGLENRERGSGLTNAAF